MSLADIEATNRDLQDAGLIEPIQPTEQAAALADVGENILLITEPIPNDQVPAAPHAAPPPPFEQTVQQLEEQEAGNITEPLAKELTSKFSFYFKNYSPTQPPI